MADSPSLPSKLGAALAVEGVPGIRVSPTEPFERRTLYRWGLLVPGALLGAAGAVGMLYALAQAGMLGVGLADLSVLTVGWGTPLQSLLGLSGLRAHVGLAAGQA